MAQIDSRLGDMIRSYREKLGLTQEEMAERLQVNLTHYGNIERAACNPSFSLFLRIAKELNLSVLLLLDPLSNTHPGYYLQSDHRVYPDALLLQIPLYKIVSYLFSPFRQKQQEHDTYRIPAVYFSLFYPAFLQAGFMLFVFSVLLL